MATAAVVAAEALARHRADEAHNHSLQNLNVKNSSYKFYYKPIQHQLNYQEVFHGVGEGFCLITKW